MLIRLLLILSRAGSAMAGFMRTLALISRHPWAQRPLVVDPFRELGAASVAAAQCSFDQVPLTQCNSSPASSTQVQAVPVFVTCMSPAVQCVTRTSVRQACHNGAATASDGRTGIRSTAANGCCGPCRHDRRAGAVP